MVTVSIAETDGMITQLVQQILKQNRLSFSQNTVRYDRDYLFLPPDSRHPCDVSLIHEPKGSCFPGDYMTIVNIDSTITLPPTQSLLITYGCNPKATVTASSIMEKDGILTCSLCIQRSLVSLKGKIIEPQEIPVSFPDLGAEIGSLLGFSCLSLVLSLAPDAVSLQGFDKTSHKI